MPAFFNGRMVASFQIPGTTPLEKLSLKMDYNSALAIGPSALRKVGGMSSGPAAHLLWLHACMVVSSLEVVKVEQHDSAAVGSCSAFFRW